MFQSEKELRFARACLEGLLKSEGNSKSLTLEEY